jgi:WD40 repeat protein
VVIVHKLSTQRAAYRWEAAGNVWSVAFGRDDREVLVGRAGRAEVWELSSPPREMPVLTLPNPGRVRALGVTRDGRTLLSASEEGREARLADATGLTGYSRAGHPTPCLAVAPDRGLAVFGEPEMATSLRRFPGGEPVLHIGGHVLDPRQVAFVPGGNLLVVNNPDGKVGVWDTAARRRVRDLTGHGGHAYLTASQDGSFVVGRCDGEEESRAFVWRPDTGELVTTLRLGVTGAPPPTFSPDGSFLATAAGDDVVLWRVGAWSRCGVLRGSQRAGAVAFSPDSGVLAVGGEVSGVTLWEVGTGRRLAVLGERTGRVEGVAFSPDGRTLVTLGGDRAVRLWHVPTLRELFTVYRHDAPLSWVQFASPTQLLVGASSTTPGRSEVLAFPPLDR